MIGIYLDNCNVPWMGSIYKLAEKMGVVLFLNNYGNVDITSRISIMSSYYIWSFDGPVIAGDLTCARYLYECPIPKKKYFYINNIEWNRGYTAVDSVKACSLELITEPAMKEVVESVWGKTNIVRNWRYEELQRIIN